MRAVGGEVRRQDAAVATSARLLLGAQDDRARAIAEQHAGAAVRPVEQPREGFGADHQRGPCLPDPQEIVGRRQGVGETRADRLQVEGDAAARAELGLHRGRGRREGVIGGGGRDQDQVQVLRADTGPRQGLARGGRRQIGGRLAVGGEMTLPDPGPLADPLVGCVDGSRQLLVAHHARRQIGADTQHD